MSQRAARPLRLLGSSWNAGIKRVGGIASPVLAVYKPCGLPYFAASQCTVNGDGAIDTKNDSSGHRLFSASPHNVPTVSPSDTSDSLLSRVTDLLPPGCGSPRVALPLMHPALTRYATASQVNAMVAQRKGTTLVACTPHEFMFLRNCHRLGLVRSLYRVLCRLPPCVAARVQHVLRKEGLSNQTTNSVFKNPYVQQFIQKRDGGAMGEATGIFLGDTLPRCAYPHTLLEGGFYSVKERSLLRHGTVSGFMSSTSLPHGVQALLKQKQKLKALFLSPIESISAASTGAEASVMDATECNVCQKKKTGNDDTVSHPWLGNECRIGLALDVKAERGKTTAYELHKLNYGEDHLEGSQEHSLRRIIGKPFRFDFRLLTLNSACDLALYEVSTNNASDEEIKTAFAAANLIVLNDYVNDTALAESMVAVTRQIHAVPQARLADFPMAVQRLLRHGSPLELVAEPISTMSLLTSVKASSNLAEPVDNLEKMRQTGLCGDRCYPFLLEALKNMGDVQVYFRVAQLALGSGLECTALHFPDPAQEANRSAVQHLLLRMEEQELTNAHLESVAERMFFTTRGATEDCDTYNAVLLRREEGGLCLPPQQDVAAAWGGGHPAVVRKEECGELSCAYCGAFGHAWSSCAKGVPLLPRKEAAPTEKDSNNETRGPRQKRAGEETLPLMSVDDVEDALQDAAAQQRGTDVILIPNTAATKEFNPHAWKRNQERPSLHRHRLRCAYCSGPHHITLCPKISNSGKKEGCPSETEVDKKQLSLHAEKLFCIKCGKRGHLCEKCPLVPPGLHTAVHCPICLLPRRKILHTPSQCPRRITPPRDYSSGGVPLVLLRGLTGSDSRGRRKPSHRGSGVLLSHSFLSQT